METVIIGLLVTFLGFGFLGFGVGRVGDKFGGHLNVPHHWIYGLVLVVVGAFLTDWWWQAAVIGFGVGHFISDLDDYLNGRVWGVDEPHEWKFWSIK